MLTVNLTRQLYYEVIVRFALDGELHCAWFTGFHPLLIGPITIPEHLWLKVLTANQNALCSVHNAYDNVNLRFIQRRLSLIKH